MADKIYQPIIGEVQKFPDQEDTILEKEVNGKTVREFFIKSPVTQKLAKIGVWPNTAPELTLEPGDWVGIGATIEVNGDFTNITARTIAKLAAEENVDDREPQPKVRRKATKSAEDVSF